MARDNILYFQRVFGNGETGDIIKQKEKIQYEHNFVKKKKNPHTLKQRYMCMYTEKNAWIEGSSLRNTWDMLKPKQLFVAYLKFKLD